MVDYKVLTVWIRLLGSNSCLSPTQPQPCGQGLDADDGLLYVEPEPSRGVTLLVCTSYYCAELIVALWRQLCVIVLALLCALD